MSTSKLGECANSRSDGAEREVHVLRGFASRTIGNCGILCRQEKILSGEHVTEHA